MYQSWVVMQQCGYERNAWRTKQQLSVVAAGRGEERALAGTAEAARCYYYIRGNVHVTALRKIGR